MFLLQIPALPGHLPPPTLDTVGKRTKSAWWHPVADHATFGAIRAGLTLPLIAGLRPSTHAAESLGAWFGGAGFNRKRLQRAADNIAHAFPNWDEARRRETALASYQHLFRLGVEVAFTPRLLTEEGWMRHAEFDGIAPTLRLLMEGKPLVLITGHCGNWESLGYTLALLGFPMHALYRPLDLKPLDTWVRQTRGRRGLQLVDKFGAVWKLPNLVQQGAPVAFVADQNAGDRGTFVPFFGRLASTYKSIGLLALQFDATVAVGQARRLHPGAPGDGPVREGFAARDDGDGLRYRIEVQDIIDPAEYRAQPDPLFYLTARYRRAIEAMVRRAPEQYLWMHRIWKSRPPHERAGKPFPPRLRQKLLDLPWMDEAEVERVVDQSDRDARRLAELGVTSFK